MKRLKPYILNILLFSSLVIALYTYKQFSPFGDQTILTIDLSQQYVDFFALYQETFRENPHLLLYSFKKGIGGEMQGLFSYYLLSPFNLILLLFPKEYLPQAVTILTLVKLQAASLTMMYFTRKVYKLDTIYSLIMSLSYALMSYAMCYQLNIMWFDGLVFLPLIAVGLRDVLNKRSGKLFIISLALALMANYYIGYMIYIFLAFYAIHVLFEENNFNGVKDWFSRYFRFILYLIIVGLISGIVIIPTFVSLLSNKASSMDFPDVDYTPVYDLIDMGSKLFIGSFNFDQMPEGPANIYAGTFVGVLMLFYITNSKIRWQEKLSALGMLVMFGLSFSFEILDKVWHGGSFPIWYMFRFSFTTSFFFINLASRQIQMKPKEYSLKVVLLNISIVTIFAMIYHYYVNYYDYLSPEKIYATFFIGLVIIYIIQNTSMKYNLKAFILLAIVIIDLSSNAVLTLEDLNYVRKDKFDDYTSILEEAVDEVRPGDNEFYRVHTTFQRTKNEAFFANYYGLDHFGSTIEAHTSDLYGYLGLPNGGGFANYSNGTIFTDHFFGIKYMIHPSPNSYSNTFENQYYLYEQAEDFDINYYPVISKKPRYYIYENSNAFGLGMEVSKDITEAEFYNHDPIYNQETLLRLIDFNGDGKPYYTEKEIKNIELENVKVADEGDGDFLLYENISEDEQVAKINMYFDIASRLPHYFTIPSQLDSDNSSLELNDEEYDIYMPYRKRQLTNASFGEIKQNQKLSIILEEEDLQINPVFLYEFDLPKFEELVEEKDGFRFECDSFKESHFSGRITTELDESYVLFTIPYDKAWKAKVDGKSVSAIAVLNDTLLAVPVTKGEHVIELKFRPSSIPVGLFVSILGIIAAFMVEYYLVRKKL